MSPVALSRLDRVVGVLRPAAAVGGLAILVAWLHGPSLGDGLFLDDWAHYRQLRECDWSLAGLTDACRLELVGGIVELWWMPECTLRFFRPVAFGTMKLVYTLSDWEPAALHAASLLWHLLACVLLMHLLRRLTASAWMAWAIAALFAVHPAHVATVQWIACQSELIVTVLLLLATLCWARYRCWPGFGPPDAAAAGPPSAGWAAAAVALFLLALGCRENAIVFPLVMACVEPLARRRRWREVAALYAACGAAIAAYLAVRTHYLRGVALPPPPYIMPPGDPDFLRFLFDKACYYLIGEFLIVPCVPIGGLPYFRGRPLLFYGLAALVIALVAALAVRHRRSVAGLLAPAWLLGFMGPLLPAFESPHHLYLPGIGWAVAAMLLFRGLGSPAADAGPRVRRLRRAGLAVLLGGTGALFGVVSFYLGLAIRTGQQVEDCVAEEIAAAPGGLASGDTLYIANLPLLAHYTRLTVEERTGLRNLRVIPLTWAPRMLGTATPAELRWVDDRTLEVHVARDRYFAGPLGLLARRSSGRPVPDIVDRTADLGLHVRVIARDAEGISALRFTFDRPLTAPGLHLFWGSRARWAYEVQPWWPDE